MSSGWFLCCLSVLLTSTTGQIPCHNQSKCHNNLGHHSQCSFGISTDSTGNCTCDEYYYLHTAGAKPTCLECSSFGDNCEASKCCNEDFLVCHNDVCMCIIYNDSCWSVNDADRVRFQRVAQCILAIALILTATILFILFWKSCTRRSVVRRHLRSLSDADSFLSLNSIQRLVLLQLQDRPPPYSTDYIHPSKSMAPGEISEPPPPYIDAVGIPELAHGQDNLMFILGEFPPVITTDEEAFGVSSTNGTVLPFQNSTSLLNNAIIQQQNVTLSTTNCDLLPSTASMSTNSGSIPEQNVVLLRNEVSIPLQNDAEWQNNTNSVQLTNTELHI